MSPWFDTLLVLLIVTDFMLVASTRLGLFIRLAAIQGFVLGIMTVEANRADLTARVLIIAAASIALKSGVFPWLLYRALKVAAIKREARPLIGPTLSLLLAVASFGMAYWLGARLPLPVSVASSLLVPVSFFTILTGFFLIVSRNKAITEVIGYLVMENGIFCFGMAFMHSTPVLVELAVLLDLAVGIFVMGIIIHHISREFKSTDVGKLSNLRDSAT